ncbi:MAG: TraL conjugative transposon family protein [Bacteroidales bacterium]|jgi:hypothetical protein|nr:TraL conjugative transposon family protein [Bacteroidales bacterium]
MTGKKINVLREWIDGGLHRMCRALPPDGRIIVMVVFFLVFGGLSVYMTVSSIYHTGQRDAEKRYMKIEHMKRLELRHSNDSIYQLKKQIYE